MGNCDTYDANALRCRPLQKAWVWRRAYFTALFRYFTLNTWSVTSQYLNKTKGEQKSFLRDFRDVLIRERKGKLDQQTQKAALERKQRKSASNRAQYLKRKAAKSQMMRSFRVKRDTESNWTLPRPVTPFMNCTGRFHISEAI